ncbi:MAG: GatB/YqeY domain-containing protein [Sulfurihydrogenibium sp.]|uniref:GatB/YqeY domain-containing protein n=1 Tax=Sulfurihydrogenibium sp. TaxID=2053621 RepID=UPI000CC65DBE|nr:MAG: glutamyl-tRNA amidotransferase [Sulfurihydrogenibium sp.]PMP78089.1 MAG: glutamyl-tRNA amidotransferase [Sulfurihydrogenibium sp.]
MAELFKRLQEEMKAAMKSGDKDRLSTIRMLISEIKKVQIDSKKELTDEEIIAILQKYVKQRKEAYEQYAKAGREDLANKELKEIEVVQEFLPQPLSEDELTKIVEETIKEVGASSVKDMGKVMKAVMDKVKGRAEGSVVSRIVKEKLS